MALSSENHGQLTVAEEDTSNAAPVAELPRRNGVSSPRLSLPDPYRVLAASVMAGMVGLSFGTAKAGKLEALRFRAENAHRLPKSEKGWYLYHKSKNYAVMLASVKEGVKFGSQLAFFVGLFFVTEIIIDSKMKQQDFRSTALTGLASGFAWSRVHSMSRQATGRMIMLGLKGGLAFGFAQDVVSLIKGRPPVYLEIFSHKKKDLEIA